MIIREACYSRRDFVEVPTSMTRVHSQLSEFEDKVRALEQAQRNALEDIVAFVKGGLDTPSSRGGNRIVWEENNGAALSNVTTRSDPSDLSDSKLELSIVTPRTADDLL
ncbi:hypothetical protein NDU88_000296 [Pleurodeles waltl]|uniref:Uncharacterized protein n=1 Tax=Pleurodeles waltl TaxID=8319 RepID=A0AAV7TFE6_PLEWA|nr:hypothetical protein NDU88_000296 [Pleurodeles waltl]